MSTTPGPSPLLALTPSQVNWAQSEQWKQIIRGLSVDIRSASPAFLTEDMNVVEQTVTAQIALQERVRTAAGLQWWDVPPIVHVPVMTPRGGGYAITLPLKKGDEGMLIFCDACIDTWWAQGQANSPVAANTGQSSGSQRQNELRRHYIHDCGFYPGLWSQKRLLTGYSSSSLQIRSDDGSVVIDVGAGGVQITAPLVTANALAGTPQPLMTDTFYEYYVAVVYPFLVSKGFVGGAPPLGSETTVLKGQ
jgi:hypothetical protein